MSITGSAPEEETVPQRRSRRSAATAVSLYRASPGRHQRRLRHPWRNRGRVSPRMLICVNGYVPRSLFSWNCRWLSCGSYWRPRRGLRVWRVKTIASPKNWLPSNGMCASRYVLRVCVGLCFRICVYGKPGNSRKRTRDGKSIRGARRSGRRSESLRSFVLFVCSIALMLFLSYSASCHCT